MSAGRTALAEERSMKDPKQLVLELMAERDRYRRALRFYANPRSYLRDGYLEPVQKDGGSKARKVLASGSAQQGGH